MASSSYYSALLLTPETSCDKPADERAFCEPFLLTPITHLRDALETRAIKHRNGHRHGFDTHNIHRPIP